MTRASRSDIVSRRLASQALTGASTVPAPASASASASDGPAVVVERMLAIQAQDLRWAKWAAAVRSPGSTLADVDRLIDSGRIVRSWPMRGTLHLVPGVDLRWMLGLTTARLWAGSATRRRDLGLDEAIIERARSLAVDALSGGRELSRADFLALLNSHDIDTTGQRGYHLIWHLAQSGTLCWGRQLDSQQTLVLLDDWVPDSRTLERDEALGEFLMRYLLGHAPATLGDFAWWSQLTLADAKVALAVVAHNVSVLSVDGMDYLLPNALDASPAPRRLRGRGRDAVIALGGFDEYLLGYRDRGLVIDPEFLGRVTPGKNGIFLPILLRSGRVIGTWHREWTARAINVRPDPFQPASPAVLRSTERALREYEAFLGRGVRILPAQP